MLARLRKSVEEKDQGFTLIELLVVIIIIGILAAIAIPVFLNQRKKGVSASMKSDLRSAAHSMETYYVDTQSYGVSETIGAGAAATGTDALGKTGFDASAGNAVNTYSGDDPVVANRAGSAIGTFCIKVTNAKGSGTGILFYDSDKGGLQPAGTGCS